MPRSSPGPAKRRTPRKAATDTSDQAAPKADGSARRARKRQASPEAPKPKRRQGADAGAGKSADNIEHGFVPKAPPPGAPAAPLLRPPEPELASGSSALGPASGTTHPIAQAATPVPRHRCSACEYPLPRSARFCRRCGVAQRHAGQPAAVPEALPAAGWLQPVPAVSPVPIAEPFATHGLSCGACGLRLPTHAKFCRACGALQLQTADRASIEVAVEADPPAEQQPIETPQPATPIPIEPPQVLIETLSSVAVADAPPEIRTCRVCAESLPVRARFCMFCAAPQTLPGITEPVQEPESATASSIGAAPAVESAAPTVEPAAPAAEPAAPAVEPAELPKLAAQIDPVTSLEPPPPAMEPPIPVEATPPPETRRSSLAPDVIERLEQARSDIDTIGRSLESLKRSLTPLNTARTHAPSARRVH